MRDEVNILVCRQRSPVCLYQMIIVSSYAKEYNMVSFQVHQAGLCVL